jgi:hypothetical protein
VIPHGFLKFLEMAAVDAWIEEPVRDTENLSAYEFSW